jgi:hypothetical protein
VLRCVIYKAAGTQSSDSACATEFFGSPVLGCDLHCLNSGDKYQPQACFVRWVTHMCLLCGLHMIRDGLQHPACSTIMHVGLLAAVRAWPAQHQTTVSLT